MYTAFIVIDWDSVLMIQLSCSRSISKAAFCRCRAREHELNGGRNSCRFCGGQLERRPLETVSKVSGIDLHVSSPKTDSIGISSRSAASCALATENTPSKSLRPEMQPCEGSSKGNLPSNDRLKSSYASLIPSLSL